MKQREYCDKCKILDYEAPVFIQINAKIFKYTNLKKCLEVEFEELESEVVKSYIGCRDILLCNKCFTEFFKTVKNI